MFNPHLLFWPLRTDAVSLKVFRYFPFKPRLPRITKHTSLHLLLTRPEKRFFFATEACINFNVFLVKLFHGPEIIQKISVIECFFFIIKYPHSQKISPSTGCSRSNFFSRSASNLTILQLLQFTGQRKQPT